jgi:hypothetical protein
MALRSNYLCCCNRWLTNSCCYIQNFVAFLYFCKVNQPIIYLLCTFLNYQPLILPSRWCIISSLTLICFILIDIKRHTKEMCLLWIIKYYLFFIQQRIPAISHLVLKNFRKPWSVANSYLFLSSYNFVLIPCAPNALPIRLFTPVSFSFFGTDMRPLGPPEGVVTSHKFLKSQLSPFAYTLLLVESI